MAEMPTYGHRVPAELKIELAELQARYVALTGEKAGHAWLRHLGDLYKRELNGEFSTIALSEVALSTATELQGATKQIAQLSTSAHELLTQLYRSKDISMEIMQLRAELTVKENEIEECSKLLAGKDKEMDELQALYDKELEQLDRQHKLNIEEVVLKQRKSFQEVLASNTQKHQEEISTLLGKIQGSGGWKLFGGKKKGA